MYTPHSRAPYMEQSRSDFSSAWELPPSQSVGLFSSWNLPPSQSPIAYNDYRMPPSNSLSSFHSRQLPPSDSAGSYFSSGDHARNDRQSPTHRRPSEPWGRYQNFKHLHNRGELVNMSAIAHTELWGTPQYPHRPTTSHPTSHYDGGRGAYKPPVSKKSAEAAKPKAKPGRRAARPAAPIADPIPAPEPAPAPVPQYAHPKPIDPPPRPQSSPQTPARPPASPADYRPSSPTFSNPAYLGLALRWTEGVGRVADVLPGSPAAAAGLQLGDIVDTFNGSAITGQQNWKEKTAALHIGDMVSLGIRRDGREKNVEMEAKAAPYS